MGVQEVPLMVLMVLMAIIVIGFAVSDHSVYRGKKLELDKLVEEIESVRKVVEEKDGYIQQLLASRRKFVAEIESNLYIMGHGEACIKVMTESLGSLLRTVNRRHNIDSLKMIYVQYGEVMQKLGVDKIGDVLPKLNLLQHRAGVDRLTLETLAEKLGCEVDDVLATVERNSEYYDIVIELMKKFDCGAGAVVAEVTRLHDNVSQLVGALGPNVDIVPTVKVMECRITMLTGLLRCKPPELYSRVQELVKLAGLANDMVSSVNVQALEAMRTEHGQMVHMLTNLVAGNGTVDQKCRALQEHMRDVYSLLGVGDTRAMVMRLRSVVDQLGELKQVMHAVSSDETFDGGVRKLRAAVEGVKTLKSLASDKSIVQ